MTEPATSPPSDRFHQIGVDEFNGRSVALALAVEHFDAKEAPRRGEERRDVLEIAQEFWDWLLETPVAFLVTIGIPYEQDSENPFDQFTRTLERGNMAEAVTLTDSQQVTVGVQAVDKKGQPVTDELTWTSADETVAGLQVAQDGSSALIVAGNPGSTSVTVADPNGLSDVIAVTVTAGAASGLTATVGTPEEQPAATTTGDTSGTVTTPPPADASSGGDAGSTTGTTDPGTAAGPGAGGVTPPAQVG